MPLRGDGELFLAIDDLIDKSNEDVKAVAISLFSQVITGTPVDTGRARNNWFLTERAPSAQRNRGRNKKGTAALRQLDRIAQSNNKNRTWYLTNNLPYIERLEFEGWSQQAPTGWVRSAVKRTRLNIKRGRL